MGCAQLDPMLGSVCAGGADQPGVWPVAAAWMQTTDASQVGTNSAGSQRCLRSCTRAVVRPCCCTFCCTDLMRCASRQLGQTPASHALAMPALLALAFSSRSQLVIGVLLARRGRKRHAPRRSPGPPGTLRSTKVRCQLMSQRARALRQPDGLLLANQLIVVRHSGRYSLQFVLH